MWYDAQLAPGYRVPRAEMPQLDAADYDEFVSFCEARGCRVLCQIVPPEALRSRQELDKLRPEGMPDTARVKPVLVSRDSDILDGNHRWMLHAAEGTPVRVMRLHLDFEAAVALMFDFPKTYRLDGKRCDCAV